MNERTRQLRYAKRRQASSMLHSGSDSLRCAHGCATATFDEPGVVLYPWRAGRQARFTSDGVSADAYHRGNPPRPVAPRTCVVVHDWRLDPHPAGRGDRDLPHPRVPGPASNRLTVARLAEATCCRAVSRALSLVCRTPRAGGGASVHSDAGGLVMLPGRRRRPPDD